MLLKKDRGTVMFLRLFKSGEQEPFVIDVQEQGISGIALNAEKLSEAFEEKTIIGPPKHLNKDSVAIVGSDGILRDIPFNIRSSSEIDKVQFTVLYPDGTTKLGERSNCTDVARHMGDPRCSDIGTLIWDDNLVRYLRGFDPADYWGDNWRNNPAAIAILNGNIVGRHCDSSTTEPC